MKKFLSLIGGIFLAAFISVLNLLFFGIIIKFSLTTIFFMFIVEIIITIFLCIFFKNKFVRVGILTATIIFLIIIGNDFYGKLYDAENKEFLTPRFYYDCEDYEETRRVKLMKDKKLSLYEKFKEIKLGKLSDSIVIIFSVKNINEITNSEFKINSLNIDYTNFGIIKIPNDKYFLNSDKFFYSNSILRILTPSGKTIIQDLYFENNGDSNAYIGYLPKHKLFVLAESRAEYGTKYTSIDWQNGQEIEGVPLFVSRDNKYYSFLYFMHVIGDLEFHIKYWKKDNNGHYQKIHDEKIPLGISIDEKKFLIPYEISNIEWDDSLTFRFVVSFNDLSKDKKESVLIQSKIIDLERD